MLKSKTIHLVKTFSESERKDFLAFLMSPYYNSNKKLITLYRLIDKYRDKLDEPRITEQFLYGVIFNGKKFNYGIMKNLMSLMFDMAGKFLVAEAQKKTKNVSANIVLLEEYSRRFLDKMFFSEYNKAGNMLAYSVLESDYFEKKAKLADILYDFYSRRSTYAGAAHALYPRSIYNVCRIISILARDIAGMDFLKNQVNFNPPVNPPESLYRSLDAEKFLNRVQNLDGIYREHIGISLMLIRLYAEPDDEENYFALKKIFSENLNSYSNSDRWLLSSRLIHFLVNGYVTGKINYIPEIAHVRRIQLEKVKFNREGVGPLQSGTFRNIIEVFSIVKELDVVESFLENHIEDLEEDNRESSYNYAMAVIEESKGNYENVLKHIQKINFVDYQVKFSAKMLALVAYYDLNMLETGLSAIDSLRHFIRDTAEFSPDARKNLGTRCRLMEKLFKIRANPEKYSVDDLSDLETEAGKIMTSRKEWFLDKTTGLKKLVGSS